jgi:hypothetical protein
LTMDRYSAEAPCQEASLRKAALIAGLCLLLMALTVPVVEFYIFPKLVDYKSPAETTNNIMNNKPLFTIAIFIHFLTIICDLIIAWALYIFLRPVHSGLALLAAWFRLVYTAFNVAAIFNLVQVLSLLKAGEYFTAIEQGQVHDAVLFYIRSFNLGWRLGLVFFGVYLCFLGYLVLRSAYIPRLVGAALIIAGLGYVIEDLKYFFYPDFDTGFLWFTFFGELIFMVWLLIRGSGIQKYK